MTLSKRFMTGILSTALVFAFLCIGCDTGGGEDGSIPAPTVDKSTLIAGITAAENAKAGVAVGTQAEVARDLPYVSRAAMDALDAAIAEAQTRKNDKSATQADVKTAVEALAAAVVAFMSHVKTDGIKTSGFTADDLRALIDLAEEAERGVTISADGMDLPSSIYWVTQSVADAFLAAIDAAEDTTSASNIDSAYTALVNALNVFKAATQPGRKAKTVTITGLPADFNRSNMYIGLSLTSKLTGNPAVSGNATVQNGSLTVSLSNEDGNPWAGTGSWYVLLYSNSKGYITESPVSFTAKDAVSVAYVGFKEAEVETVGSVKGSVTLNNVPAPRPAVRILALYGEGWYPIDMLGTGGIVNADGSFEIPFSQGFLTALQTGGQTIRFRLIIGSDESNYQINLPEKAVTAGGLSGRDLNVGNIGAASLTTLTLSGTLVVQDGSQSVPRVDIRAHGDNGSLGRVSLSSPSVNGEPWSLTVATQQGEIYFSVTGYDSLNGENQLFSTLFYPSKTAMVSASDKSIDNINLDCGDVSTGRLSGTIAFTNMPSPAPYWIGIFAEYDNDSSWRQIDGYSEVSLSGTSGTWRLPRDDTFLAALNSRDRKVRFEVQVQFTSNENAVTFAAIEKTIGRSSLSGIDLGSVSLALITLNGTVKVNNGGQPIPQVEIIAHTENRDALGGVRLPSPPVGGQTWSITILPQQGEKVYFHVSGYDTDEKRLFSKSFEPPETVSVSSQSISGINFDIGDLKHTVTFVNNGFSMPISVLDGMSLGAAYPSNESMGAPSNGFISDAQYKVFTGWRDQDGNGVHEWTPIQKDLTVQPTFYEIPATDAITVGTDAPQTVTLKLEIDISETRVNGHKYFRLVQSDGLQADHVYKVEADYTITSPTGFHFVSFSASLDQYGWHADWLNDLTTSGSVSISIPNKVPADSKNQTA
ncbi:MAG: hypothetical protein LBH75_03845, partial [Treponema sp.]|nr:hypothetical protein [Treponema sp.]